jgi:hypothetical protein
MTPISDEFMRDELAKTRQYSVVLLYASDQYGKPGHEAVVWEHGRRNFQLRSEGRLSIVAPVTDDTDLCGVGIFPGTVDEVADIMADDPGVQAGLFTFQVHPIRSFPGDALP